MYIVFIYIYVSIISDFIPPLNIQMLYPFRSLVPRLGGLILEGDIFDETMGVKRFQRICALRHRPLMCRGASTDGGNMEIP